MSLDDLKRGREGGGDDCDWEVASFSVSSLTADSDSLALVQPVASVTAMSVSSVVDCFSMSATMLVLAVGREGGMHEARG